MERASGPVRPPERVTWNVSGIVGLPNAGKSSLFNALTGGNAVVAAHPFSTTETNVGIAKVPDARLDRLARDVEVEASSSAPRLEFVDIAGLVRRAPTAARAWATGSSARHPRGRRPRCSCCGPSTTRTSPATPIRSTTWPPSSSSSSLADVASGRAPSSAGARRPGPTSRSPARSTALEPALPPPRPTARPCTGRGCRPSELDARRHRLPAHGQADPGGGEPGRRPARPTPTRSSSRWPPSSAVLPRCWASACSWRRRRPRSTRRERAELLEGLGLGEGALPRVDRSAYHLLGPPDVPDHGRQGVAGPGRSGPAPRRPSAPA